MMDRGQESSSAAGEPIPSEERVSPKDASPAATKKPPRRWRRWVLLALCLQLVAAILFWRWLPVNGVFAAQEIISWKFDDVRHMPDDVLGERYGYPHSFILLDVRQREEFAVSHLRRARRLDPAASDAEIRTILAAIPSNQLMVLYCSVGYRSSHMCRRLQALGRTNVYNLDGGIFAWAAHGRCLEPRPVVHPYNWFGRRMLPEKLVAD